MKHWHCMFGSTLAAVILLVCGCEANSRGALSHVQPELEPGFVPLFNGTDLSEFTPVKAPADIWSVRDGVISCKGMPFGWLATKKHYRNFTLRLELRYPQQAGNSGIFLFANDCGKKWPRCVEVQGKYEAMCMLFGLSGTKGGRVPGDSVSRETARKPHTEWNALEITTHEGAVTAKLNGVVISQSKPFDAKEGPIALQSEGAPIEFRRLRIKVAE